MAYQAISFTYGEIPSAAKWNILGTNDASFNDGTGIANGVITSEHLNATIACRVYRAAALTVGGGEESLLFDTENFDLGSDFNTTTGQFTAPLTGYYHVSVTAAVANVDDAGQVLAIIRANGSSVAYSNGYSSAATADPRPSVSDLVSITAGQVIEGFVDCSTSESLTAGSANTFMSVYFVGA